MHRFGPPPQFQQQPSMGPQFPPQFNPQFMPQNQMNMPPPPPPMNFQGPPQMNFQGPPQMNMQGPPQMNFQGPPQMNMQGPPQNFQHPQMRMNFPPQNIQFTQQQLPPIPAQSMSPPRPEVPQFRLINPAPQQQMPNFERPQTQEVEQAAPQPEFRIQLRRIQLPGPMSDIMPFLNSIQNNMQNEMQKEGETPRQNVHVQQMPLAVALSKVGITPDDLRNIQRMAEEKFHEHIRELVAEEVDADDTSIDSDSTQSEEETDSGMQTTMPDQESSEEPQKNESQQGASSQQEQSDEQEPQILALGRSNFGRSLNPIQLPDHMTQEGVQDGARADCELK